MRHHLYCPCPDCAQAREDGAALDALDEETAEQKDAPPSGPLGR